MHVCEQIVTADISQKILFVGTRDREAPCLGQNCEHCFSRMKSCPKYPDALKLITFHASDSQAWLRRSDSKALVMVKAA
jgi:hypothetical protein